MKSFLFEIFCGTSYWKYLLQRPLKVHARLCCHLLNHFLLCSIVRFTRRRHSNVGHRRCRGYGCRRATRCDDRSFKSLLWTKRRYIGIFIFNVFITKYEVHLPLLGQELHLKYEPLHCIYKNQIQQVLWSKFWKNISMEEFCDQSSVLWTFLIQLMSAFVAKKKNTIKWYIDMCFN